MENLSQDKKTQVIEAKHLPKICKAIGKDWKFLMLQLGRSVSVYNIPFSWLTHSDMFFVLKRLHSYFCSSKTVSCGGGLS